jgi:hypothetical protein
MIENKNKKKFKPFMIYCFLDYLSFNEKLKIRLTCKIFNNSILDKLPFLQKDNLFNMNKKYLISIKEKYDFSYKKKKQQLSFLESNKENDFNSTEKKCFSKKLTLIRLLNNNNYMLIKKNVKLGELQIPKKLYI